MYFLLKFGTTRQSFISHQPVGGTLSINLFALGPSKPDIPTSKEFLAVNSSNETGFGTSHQQKKFTATSITCWWLTSFKQEKLLLSACLPSSRLILNSLRMELIPAVRKTPQTI